MPNYMVCLSHFCEIHGPSTIICTQVFLGEKFSQSLLKSTSKLSTCASCKLIVPSESANLVTELRDGPEGQRRTFVSTQYPSSQQRYSSLAKMVMKSLSVETTSDISKPIFFGDGGNGYSISKIFKIMDNHARGSERKYSLIISSDTEVSLLQNWDNVAIYMEELVSLIQNQVEEATEKISRLRRSKYSNDCSFLDNERFLRRSMLRPRSLVELTDDDQIFPKLHLIATELLRDIMRWESA